MVVRGETLGTFSIDCIPDQDLQVMIQSKLMVIGTNGVEYGNKNACIISRPIRCLQSVDSDIIIKDWQPYLKEESILEQSEIDSKSYLKISFFIGGIDEEAKVKEMGTDSHVDEHADEESDTKINDCIENRNADMHEKSQERIRKYCSHENTIIGSKQNSNHRSNQKLSKKTADRKSGQSKPRKRAGSKKDKDTPKMKLKRKIIAEHDENVIDIQKVKTEQGDYDEKLKCTDKEIQLSDNTVDIKVEDSMNESQPKLNNSVLVSKIRRAANKRSKCLKRKTNKEKHRKRNPKESVLTTEGMDPKLVYAKKSLEKQKLKNSQKIRVELEDYSDKYTITTVESLAQKDRGKSKEEKSYQSYECTICGRFQSAIPEKIRFHIEQHINGELECKKCGYILSYPKEISRHNNEIHKADFVNKRVCELCGMTARSFRMWKAHMSKIHKVPSFKCKHCSEKFFNAAEVVEHTRKAHKDIVLTCDKCGQIFVSRSNWSYHSVRCTGTTNTNSFVCDQCGKDLGSAIALKRHVRHSHEMEKTHKCSYCSYATHTIARLQKHINAHLGIKQYHCEVCEFSCVQKYQLTSHMRTHNGVKPFHCDQCPYAVAWNVQLKAHKKVHRLSTAVTCKTCGVVYRDDKTLKKHEQKDHGEKSSSEKGSSKDSDVSNFQRNANVSLVSNSVTYNLSNTGRELFIDGSRNVGVNGSQPSFNGLGMMNVNNNHMENNVQFPAEMPMFPFSYQ